MGKKYDLWDWVETEDFDFLMRNGFGEFAVEIIKTIKSNHKAGKSLEDDIIDTMEVGIMIAKFIEKTKSAYQTDIARLIKENN